MPGKKPTHTGRDSAASWALWPLSVFQSTRPIRGATVSWRSRSRRFAPFQSTRPIRGATGPQWAKSRQRWHFNPRAPYGARPKPLSATRLPPTFQSTRPIRGATLKSAPSIRSNSQFQSTRPIRGATVWSIPYGGFHNYFNPRAPYGARLSMWHSPSQPAKFQSTRPIRGATRCPLNRRDVGDDFNPRAPYGARLLRGRMETYTRHISIHAPHTGRDLKSTVQLCQFFRFQSTRPIRGATLRVSSSNSPLKHFNPRAPYGARLPSRSRCPCCTRYFNPRAPYGARHTELCDGRKFTVFQSTRPIRGATHSP